jgi:hypothetical protein
MNFKNWKESSFYKNNLIPVAHALLWIMGLLFTLWGMDIFDMTESSDEVKNAYSIGLVYVLFLVEIGLGFIDIGYNYKEYSFSSKVFKTVGLMVGDIAMTIVFTALYVGNKTFTFLLLMILATALLKCVSVYMSRNVGTYFALNALKRNYTHRPNKIKQ